jgi:hypothetical protein
VSPADVGPLFDIRDVHSGADYIRQRRTGRLQRAFDVAECLDGLGVRVTGADDYAVGSGCRCA